VAHTKRVVPRRGWQVAFALVAASAVLVVFANPAMAAYHTSGQILPPYYSQTSPYSRCATGESAIFVSGGGGTTATSYSITRSIGHAFCLQGFSVPAGDLRSSSYTLTRHAGGDWVLCTGLTSTKTNPTINQTYTGSWSVAVSGCRQKMVSMSWHVVVIDGIARGNAYPYASPEVDR
jgi:hypothetical protein